MRVEYTCGCIKEQKDELLPDDAIVQQGIACQIHWRDQMDEQTKMYEQTNALPAISAGNVMQRKFAANLRYKVLSIIDARLEELSVEISTHTILALTRFWTTQKESLSRLTMAQTWIWKRDFSRDSIEPIEAKLYAGIIAATGGEPDNADPKDLQDTDKTEKDEADGRTMAAEQKGNQVRKTTTPDAKNRKAIRAERAKGIFPPIS